MSGNAALARARSACACATRRSLQGWVRLNLPSIDEAAAAAEADRDGRCARARRAAYLQHYDLPWVE